MDIAKEIHILCVLVTFVGFIGRGILIMRRSPVMSQRWLKIVPHVNDTLLLATAIYLAVQLNIAPWDTLWLGVKLVLVLLYIGLGMVVMRPRFSFKTRITLWVVGLVVFAYIVSIALTKSVTPWVL